MAANEKTIEGRLPYLAKAEEAYLKILAFDPNNSSAKSSSELYQGFPGPG